MPEAQLSNPRKRRNPERLTPQQNKTSQHVSKKQKRSHPSGSQLPPAFWDNLSKIDLTKRALEELDRRNTQAAPNSQNALPTTAPTDYSTRSRRAEEELPTSRTSRLLSLSLRNKGFEEHKANCQTRRSRSVGPKRRTWTTYSLFSMLTNSSFQDLQIF